MPSRNKWRVHSFEHFDELAMVQTFTQFLLQTTQTCKFNSECVVYYSNLHYKSDFSSLKKFLNATVNFSFKVVVQKTAFIRIKIFSVY